MNWDAMIDCLSNIHYPYEQISEVTLGKDETLFIYCKDLSKVKFDISTFIMQ